MLRPYIYLFEEESLPKGVAAYGLLLNIFKKWPY